MCIRTCATTEPQPEVRLWHHPTLNVAAPGFLPSAPHLIPLLIPCISSPFSFSPSLLATFASSTSASCRIMSPEAAQPGEEMPVASTTTDTVQVSPPPILSDVPVAHCIRRTTPPKWNRTSDGYSYNSPGAGSPSQWISQNPTGEWYYAPSYLIWASNGYFQCRVFDLKAALMSLTDVPPERQKILGLVKGKLPDDDGRM